MEQAGVLTQEQRREINRKGALMVARNAIDTKNLPRRFVSGVAIDSYAPNANGMAFCALGAEFTLPVPLLVDHSLAGCDRLGDRDRSARGAAHIRGRDRESMGQRGAGVRMVRDLAQADLSHLRGSSSRPMR